MAKGLTQGAAWGISILFSIILFSGIMAVILGLKPSAKSQYSGSIRADDVQESPGEIKADDYDKSEAEIKADDQASLNDSTSKGGKKKSYGHIRVKMDRASGLT